MVCKMKTITELMDELSKTEYLVIDKYDGLVIVYSRETLIEHGQERIKRLYEIIDAQKGYVSEIDVNGAIQEIISKISDKIELKKVLKEAVATNNPKNLVEALKRLQDQKLRKKAKPVKGCYSIKIPGNKGQRPIELTLIS